MKHSLYIVLLLVFVYSCENTVKETFKGDIYITLINVYDVRTLVPEDKILDLKNEIIKFDTIGKSESKIKMNTYFQTLIDHDLFDKPCFQVQFKNDEIINVYIDEAEYSKLSKLLKDLDRYHEKIVIEFEGEKISDGIYDRAIYSASKIISVDKKPGKTNWKK